MDLVIDALIDSLKLLPFLFFTFIIIEFIENKAGQKSINLIKKSKNYGPLLGGILGATPQCGLGVMATNLYVTNIISIGTLIAIYLSTSDEMLPILISHKTNISEILIILFFKVLIGILCGFIIDIIFFNNRKKLKINTDAICKEEHCHCEENILKSSLIHTIKTFIFIFLFTVGLNIIIALIGKDNLSKFLTSSSIFAPFIASLIGLIPNCAASVVITELYLSKMISFGTMIAGLLSSSGVALLVLYKSDKKIKDALTITFILYFIGVLVGILFNLINFTI